MNASCVLCESLTFAVKFFTVDLAVKAGCKVYE